MQHRKRFVDYSFRLNEAKSFTLEAFHEENERATRCSRFPFLYMSYSLN